MNNRSLSLIAGIILLFALGGVSVAQSSLAAYDLSTYKLPRLERHYLEADIGWNGANFQSESDSHYEYNLRDSDSERSNSSLGLKLSPMYSYYLNSPKFQISQSLNMWGSTYNSSKEESSGVYTTNDRKEHTRYSSESIELSPRLRYQGDFKEFIYNKIFLEQELNAYWSYNNLHTEQSQINITSDSFTKDTENKFSRNLNVTASLSTGWGRIEQIQDARLAIYILEDLIHAGVITKEVTDEDIQILAEVISKVLNTRGFDLREKKIWELEQVDSVLKDLEFLADESITYYTCLNDNWDYAKLPVRLSGMQFSFGAAYYIGQHHSASEFLYEGYDYKEDESSYRDGEGKGIGVIAKAQYEKPLNHKWQLSLQNDLSLQKEQQYYEWDNQHDQFNFGKIKTLELQNTFQAEISYYPNTRTNFSLANSITYQGSTDEREFEIRDQVSGYLRNSSWLSSNYYLSPRFRLAGHIGYSISTMKSEVFEYSDSQSKHSSLSYMVQLTCKLL